MYLDYPPTVDEAKAIEERLDRGEELDAPTRDSARFPRAGHLVAVQYPNGEVHYLRNAKGEYLHAPGGEDLIIPAEGALDLGWGDWGMFQPPRPENKPVFPLPIPTLRYPLQLPSSLGLLQ